MSKDKSASKETGTIPFIVENGLHKADQDTRRFIRMHVMLGKNTGKDPGKRRPKKGKPRRPPPVFIPLAIAPRPNEAIHTSPNPLPSDYPPSIPQRVGTDVSLVQLADAVDPSTASLVLRFSAVAKQTLFPLESCILFDKQEGKQWVELMAFDPIFLHTMIFTTLSYHNSLRRYENYASRDTRLSLHFTQALRLLRERLILDNDEMRFSDITVCTVLGLAVYAYLTGEREAAEYHLSALRTIIDLRGGLSVFWKSEKLLLELFRCDIGQALHTGSTTYFFTDPSVEPFVPYPEQYLSFALGLNKIDMQGNQDNLVAELDDDLAKVYSVVKHFSAHVNLAYENKSKLPKELLVDATASIMYRLIHMSYRHGSLSECIRLGLLAYSSSVFLQWKDTRMSHHHISSAYRDSMTASSFSSILSEHFQLWLLITGAISIFDEHNDQWLKPQLLAIINSCSLDSWDQVRDILHSIMWVDLLHDYLGRKYFDSMVNDGSPSTE